MTENSIETLRGAELNAVSFVMDYIEFHFNGPVLRALTRPTVELDGVPHRLGDPGSRDAACALIGSAVEDALLYEGHLLEIRLSGNNRLLIPLDETTPEVPDAIEFVPSYGQAVQIF